MRDDEAIAIIAAMREEKAKTRRRRTWGKSKLTRFRTTIVAMHRNGASYEEIAQRLSEKHRCSVVRSTVLRYIQKLPEVNGGAST